MPQLLLLFAVGIMAWLGYRAFLREAERVHRRVRQAEKEAENRASGTLVKDPETGEYRVRQE